MSQYARENPDQPIHPMSRHLCGSDFGGLSEADREQLAEQNAAESAAEEKEWQEEQALLRPGALNAPAEPAPTPKAPTTSSMEMKD